MRCTFKVNGKDALDGIAVKAPWECAPSVTALFTLPVDEGDVPLSNAAQYKVPPIIPLLPVPLLTRITDRVILDLVTTATFTAATLEKVSV